MGVEGGGKEEREGGSWRRKEGVNCVKGRREGGREGGKEGGRVWTLCDMISLSLPLQPSSPTSSSAVQCSGGRRGGSNSHSQDGNICRERTRAGP